MRREFRAVLCLGAFLCAPLTAAAQAVRGVAPVSAGAALPVLPASVAVLRVESGLKLPALAPIVQAPALVPAATVRAAPASAAVLRRPVPGALALPAAAAGARSEAPARGAASAEEEKARPAGRFAELKAARTLPRLVFDGAGLGEKAAPEVAAGPAGTTLRAPALSRPASGAASRSVRPGSPARPDPERPSFLKRLRASPWGLALGFTALAAGAVMLVTPGPGAPFLLAGLYLLSPHFDWARKGLMKVRVFVKEKIFRGDLRRWKKFERFLGM